MKKGIKIALITALILLGIGIVLMAVSFCMVGFEFSAWNGLKAVSNTHQIKEAFTDIDVNTVEADVKIEKSDTGNAYVVCNETDKILHEVKVENGTLKITHRDDRSWWEHIGIFWAEMSVTVYLPDAEYGDLNIQGVSGRVSLNSVKAECIQAGAVSGDIEVRDVSCKTLSADTASGNITLSDTDARGEVRLESTSGRVEWRNGTGNSLQISAVSGNLMLQNCLIRETLVANTTSGEIRMQACDAQALTVSSTSGNIRLELLTGKIYQASTVSGNIDVPTDNGSGLCTLSTVSGNIRVTVGG